MAQKNKTLVIVINFATLVLKFTHGNGMEMLANVHNKTYQ
jgi:hypothetical protein